MRDLWEMFHDQEHAANSHHDSQVRNLRHASVKKSFQTFLVRKKTQNVPCLLRGEKPYECNICNKSFTDPSARRRHVASHSGQKPFNCSICNLSFTRLDNLKTHIKSHNKEKAAADTPPVAAAAEAPSEEVRNVLQLQQYQLPSGSQQEIQLVVTEDGTSINFVPSQGQEISIVTTEEEEGEAEERMTGSSHPRLTLLSQPTGNMTLVGQNQQSLVEQNPHIQTISMLDGPVAYQPDQMHIISLSKEAMEQLQVHHGHLQQPLQVMQAESSQQQQQQRGAGGAGRDKASQGIHISSQSSQPISISQTSEEMSGHHIQGQTFQIQAGTVSYLYTTGLPQGS